MKKHLIALFAGAVALAGFSGAQAEDRVKTWKPQDGDALFFGIYDNEGERVGTYSARFRREDGKLIVDRRQNIAYTRMMMTLFNMDQQASATFSRKGLESLRNRIDIQFPTGGENRWLNVNREGSVLRAENRDGAHELPSGAWPIMFWHRSIIKRTELFDMATGETRPFYVTSRGYETVEADGDYIECEAFAINTVNAQGQDAAFVVWYEENSKFCGMEFDTPVGKLTFRRETEDGWYADDPDSEEESPV